MTISEFLTYLLPDQGPYCLAFPYKIKSTGKMTFYHKVSNGLKSAVITINEKINKENVFFALHSLKEARRFNPKKLDPRTGELGAYEVRTHANMCMSRTFYLDLDVGSVDEGKHASQADALIAIRAFCKSTGLPKPMLTSSGGGVHVFWRLDTAIPSEDWLPHARNLKALTEHYDLKADPTRTADRSSVLRVAGTFNHKDKANPRPVVILTQGKSTDTDTFLQLLTDATVGAGLDVSQRAAPKASTMSDLEARFGNNTDTSAEKVRVSLKAMAETCGQFRRFMKLRGTLPEPQWYLSLQMCDQIVGGEKLIHKISNKYPNYSPDEVEAKFEHGRHFGPPLCDTLRDKCGPEHCVGCRYVSSGSAPLVHARKNDSLPPPVAPQLTNFTQPPVVIPPAPPGYKRTPTGVWAAIPTKDGNNLDVLIYPYDLYPIDRLKSGDVNLKKEHTDWHATLPNGEEVDFTIPSTTLYDQRELMNLLPNVGIYPNPENVKHLQAYMIAYVDMLQRGNKANIQHTRLGWTDTFDGWVHSDVVYKRDGSCIKSQLMANVRNAAMHVSKVGTLQRQVELLRFYDNPAYLPIQFYIGSSLGAPLFHMTGYNGVVVNASGKTGVSKSTALYTAMSLWGRPEMLTMSGLSTASTARGREAFTALMSNIPIGMDEVTLSNPQDILNMSLGVSQTGGNTKLGRDGVLRPMSVSPKSTILLTTSNTSIHHTLSTDTIAGSASSMRVMEIQFERPTVHTKEQADDFMRELKQNHGWVGEEFIKYVVKNYDAVADRVVRKVREIDGLLNASGRERFWTAVAAACIVALEIARELGLLSFDAAAVQEWALRMQIPASRDVVSTSFTTPIEVLTNFFAQHINDIYVLNKLHPTQPKPSIESQPRASLVGQHNIHDHTMYVIVGAFKDYCHRHHENSTSIVDQLARPVLCPDGSRRPVIISKSQRPQMGGSNDNAAGRPRVFVVDMAHPEIAASVPVQAASNPAVQTTPSRAKLSVVPSGSGP